MKDQSRDKLRGQRGQMKLSPGISELVHVAFAWHSDPALRNRTWR